MMLLELMHKISIGLRKGKVIIYLDQKQLTREVKMENKKASDFVEDYGAIKCRIKKIQSNLNVSIQFKHTSKEVKMTEKYEDNK